MEGTSGTVRGTIDEQNEYVEVDLGGKYDTLAVQVKGTYAVSALSLQVSVNGTDFITAADAATLKKYSDGVATATIPAAAVGIWRADVSGFSKARIVALGAITGSAEICAQAGVGSL